MNKYFIFASDARSYLELVNIVKELQNKNEQYFFLYTTNTTSISPINNINKFNYDTNIENTDKQIFIQNLGFDLSFIPDVVLLTHENWSPEKELIHEFKTIGSVVCCLENSNWLYNNIKTRLELLSRMTFPTNLIDRHFDHSVWEFETKKIGGWLNYKTEIIGTPKFDNVFDDIDVDRVIDKYKLNTSKKNILFYGSMENEMRINMFKELNYMRNNLSNDFEILYRPHPSEFQKFKTDFNPKFWIEGVKVIDDDMDVKSISYFSDIHVSLFSGVVYNTLIYDKKLIIDRNNFGTRDELNMDIFREKEFPFWSNVFKVDSWGEFKKIVDVDLLEMFIKRYDNWWDIVSSQLDIYDRDLKWSLNSEPSENNSNLLSYFDDWNDGNASRRLINSMNTMKGSTKNA